jgi:uncharacterized protein (TIGR00255 family)
MTGHGEAHRQQDGVAVAVEVRTVNNRYFKLSLRITEGYTLLEAEIESLVRKSVRRGSVQVNVHVDRDASPDDFQLNEVVLNSYRRQLDSLARQDVNAEPIRVEALLALPGVVREHRLQDTYAESDWPLIKDTLNAALEGLAQMRVDEGAAMAVDFRENCRAMSDQLGQIQDRAPLVIEAYRARLSDRLNKLLEEYKISIEAADIAREVGIFAERSDISEEIVRLRSHLDQFSTIAAEKESNGRKLEFLIQEMLRETNTIGSKANDSAISRNVIEIKSRIERMREMVQNVE